MLSQENTDDNLEPLGSYFFGNRRSFPAKQTNSNDRNFLVIESRTSNWIEFDELEKQCHSLARALLSLFGVNETETVAIMSESCIDYIVTIGACLLLNIPYCLIKPAYGPYNLAQQLRLVEPKFLFISINLFNVVQRMFANNHLENKINYLKIIIINDNTNTDDQIIKLAHKYNGGIRDNIDFSQLKKLKTAFQCSANRIEPVPYFKKSLNDTITIAFTSGTTGTPKAVCHTHRSILTNIKYLQQFLPFKQHQHLNLLLTFPIGHVSGHIHALTAIASRTPIILLNYANNKHELFQTIEKYCIGQIMGPVNVMNDLVELPMHLSSVKLIMSAGCKLPYKTAQLLFNKYRIKIIDSYGSSECLFISANDCLDKIPINVGKVLPCTKVRIVNLVTGRPVNGPRECGEIQFSGNCIFREYYHNPDETNSSMTVDGWYRSGDLGFFDEHHNLHLCERIKEIIKFKGWSVFPADIEQFLLQHEAISCTVVVPVKHIHYNQVPRAYVVLKKDYQITVEQLHQYINDNLGFQQRIRGGIILVDHLKYNSMGKIERNYYKNICNDEILDSLEN